jgi:hypothetical protein
MSVAGATTVVGASDYPPYESTLKPSDMADIKGKRMPSVAEAGTFDEVAHTAGMVRLLLSQCLVYLRYL